MKILVADDDVTSRLVLSSILSKWGEDVETVCDGNEAWAYLQAHPDSLIAILDWRCQVSMALICAGWPNPWSGKILCM